MKGLQLRLSWLSSDIAVTSDAEPGLSLGGTSSLSKLTFVTLTAAAFSLSK